MNLFLYFIITLLCFSSFCTKICNGTRKCFVRINYTLGLSECIEKHFQDLIWKILNDEKSYLQDMYR